MNSSDEVAAAAGRGLYPPEVLRPFVAPKSVAIVGPVHKNTSIASLVLSRLRGHPAFSRVVAVGPTEPDEDGEWLPTADGLARGGGVDLLVVAAPAATVVETFGGAADSIKGCLVLSSGFADAGPDGRREQELLAAMAREADVPLLGPNCLGTIDFPRGLAFSFAPVSEAPSDEEPDGDPGGHRLAIVTQSGGLGLQMTHARLAGFRVGQFLAAGNSADVDAFDLAGLALSEPSHGAVLLVIEGVANQASERVRALGTLSRQLGKPVVIHKAGSGGDAQRAAASHSGTLTGSTDAFAALADEAGIVVADRFEDMIELGNHLLKQRSRARVSTVGIVTTSGGAGVVIADAAGRQGFGLPAPSPATVTSLGAMLSAHATVANPVDLTTATVGAGADYQGALEAIGSDDRFDSVVVPLTTALDKWSDDREKAIERAADKSTKPFCAVWLAGLLDADATNYLASSDSVSLFRSADRCTSALRAGDAWARRLAGGPADDSADHHGRALPDAGGDEAEADVEATSTVGEVIAAQWCREAGLRLPQQVLAASAEEAVAAAGRIGYPVCVKIAIDDVAHKSDLGGLRLDLGSADEVEAAYDEVVARVRDALPDAVVRGVLVQEMIGAGLELLISVRKDPAWGVVASIGAGGVRTELLDDVVVLSLPSAAETVRERLARLRLHPLFGGYRNEPAYDLEAVLEVVDGLDRFLRSRPDIVELEVNPLIVRPGDGGAIAVDAMARVTVTGDVSEDAGTA